MHAIIKINGICICFLSLDFLYVDLENIKAPLGFYSHFAFLVAAFSPVWKARKTTLLNILSIIAFEMSNECFEPRWTCALLAIPQKPVGEERNFAASRRFTGDPSSIQRFAHGSHRFQSLTEACLE